ncbi:hypothetical protein GCM10011494_08130 [Novosphingobium endophyticum]|uniref:Uncharacterized protein n=1 Tax=Novosphingobium endophyticum TaxID=1955250 RepID=A0A916TQ03_9SPHN|nr:hypothetical protein [Novosphingobium endophyticum]GGB92129.1 hypothetical protein GCM10011494_08130 [Novosphingobium endophyticum]
MPGLARPSFPNVDPETLPELACPGNCGDRSRSGAGTGGGVSREDGLYQLHPRV